MNCMYYPAENFLYIFSSASYIPKLFYYAFIPSSLFFLFLGIFIYIKSNQKLLKTIFLFITIYHALYTTFDLITWVDNYSQNIMFGWSLYYIFAATEILFFLYFIKVFITGKDISTTEKIVLFLLLLPIANIKYNLQYYDNVLCEAYDISFSLIYCNLLSLSTLLYIIGYTLKRYKQLPPQESKKTLLIAAGIIIYALPLIIFSIDATLIVRFFNIALNYNFELYGFLGLPIFISFIIYLIIRYQIFGIKLHQAQALVLGVIVLIGSQIFYIQNTADATVTMITLTISVILGLVLIRSISKADEKKQKQLEKFNAQLQQDKQIVENANQELIKLDQAKTEFINIASHQLRTPVTVIKGIASMALAGQLKRFPDADQHQFYESLWNKSKKLEDIIKDILSAASLTNRKYTIEANSLSDIHLETFFSKIIQDFELELQEKNLTIAFEAKSPDLTIQGQKDDLEDALSNLIDNAIRYTETTANQQGSIKISIEQQPNNQVRIVIADNGIGISEDERAKIFEKFFRAKNAKQAYTDGSGLGLFIVKEIIEGHGGRVWVESQVEVGSTFFVELPNFIYK